MEYFRRLSDSSSGSGGVLPSDSATVGLVTIGG
jgi:hypothetical protein